MRAAGVDGCKAGWLCLSRDPGGVVAASCVATADGLLRQVPAVDIVAIDIPIGLKDSGTRTCDTLARSVLGPRRSSVFNAPLRPMLAAKDWKAACKLGQQADGRKISKQTWAIVPKIREVDALLRSTPAAQDRVREVHPEVCFWAWHGKPMDHSKKTSDGHRERFSMVEGHFGAGSFSCVRLAFAKSAVADDDILDAFAALWTAERIAAGAAQQLPPKPPRDSAGLRMEMVF